jgi:hypothetical protein
MKIRRTMICAVALGVMADGVLLMMGGCSSNSSPNSTPDSGTNGSSGTSSSGGSSSGISSGSSSAGSSSGTSGGDAGTDSSTEDAGCTTLNLYNFKAWCSGTINGTTDINDNDATPGTTTTTTVCLPPGAASLVASPLNSNFELGPNPWIFISGTDGGPMSGTIGTDGGTDGGTATSTTTVTLGTAPGCVLLCCPFTSGVHGGVEAGPGEMSGCTPGQTGFGGDGGDGGFASLCP